MELKSLAYIIFIFAILVFYFLSYRIPKGQKVVIALANTTFILSVCGIRAWFMILILTLAVFGMGILIEKNRKNKKLTRTLQYFGVLFVVAVLCYFKFFKWTYELLATAMLQKNIVLTDLITPVGISYYSLTMCAYLIDISHKKHNAERNFFDFYVFITFFPSIIQGPINLYKKVAPQLKESHSFDWDRMVMGLQRSLWGYFKKIVIADRIGVLVIGILKDETSAGYLLLWAMVLYSFQIYADFSGGIDVVMGIAEIMDIKLTENFKAPLVSKSITEYWQRWHESLGEFMEKYIYYPVVLDRSVMKFSKKIPNQYISKAFSATLASVVVFIIVGIWHGTGWNYVVYGCYQALFVASAVLLGPAYKKLRAFLKINADCLSFRLFQILRTFMILVVGRYFIRAKDLTQAFDLMRKTFANLQPENLHVLFDDTMLGFGLDYKNLFLMYICIMIIILVDILHEKGLHFRELLMKQDIIIRYAVYFVMLFGIIILGIYGPGFSGASFIYQGF